MELVEIREDGGRPGGSVVRLDGYDYPTTIEPPFDEKQEGELDWYFEEHLRFPFIDRVRAREAGTSVSAYGEALFGRLIAGDEVREAYGALKRRAYPDKLTIAIVGSPAFQALHWEALKDPKLPRAFALDAPIIRRRSAAAPPLEAVAADSPTLNLLVITARPHGAYDVGYRTITRPLIETLRNAQLRVDVDLARPGTWQALVERLEAATQRHGAGHYHAIHFDLHGGLLGYEEFQRLQEAPEAGDKLAFRARWGRDAIEPYQGIKAFLSFEREAGDGPDLGEASEVAALLLKHKIPIAILNACQSGKQVGAEETSLGAQLLQAGVQSVLAMAWSVTVSAAERLIPALYGELFASQPLGTAVLAARRALHDVKERRAAYNETIELEDWVLPVVYQNREPKLAFREFQPEEAQRWYTDEAERFPAPEPEYGFFGRDLDVLRIEKALLTKRNLLLVQGMGGSGKTTLLRHLAHWQELTGLVERSFYFGWDEQAWTRAQILRLLAPEVLPADVIKVFDAMSATAQQQAVAQALRGKRWLLILDNLESVTAAPLAIPHSLSESQRGELQSFLKALQGGDTLVLLGSRGDEAWLAKGTFEDNVHRLEGLDPEAASDLADAVLRRAGAQQRREETAFKELMELLAGYPLALQVVLPNLATKTAAEVLEALRRGLAEIDKTLPGEDLAVAKTRSLMACIEYSHGHLDPEAQALLACFAPFTGAINTGMLERYGKMLAEEPALAGLPFERLGEVLELARKLGLLSPDAQMPKILHPQPALAWFLTNRLAALDQAERRAAIERAFRKHYDMLAGSLSKLQQSKKPEERKLAHVLVEQEYANIGTALRLALAQRASIRNSFVALSHHLDRLQDHRRGLELGEIVLAALEREPPEALTGQRGVELAGIVDTIARWQLLAKRFDEARAGYEKALAMWDRLGGLDARMAARVRASILHQLGAVAQEQLRFIEAEDHYKQARDIFIAFDHRPGLARTCHQLGNLSRLQRRFAEAEGYYKQALEIKIALGDRHSAGDTYHQLGMVAEEQRLFAEAECYYKRALEIYIAFGDHHRAASAYHQLGIVAQEQRRFGEAEGYYKKALEIYIAFGDRHSAALTYHQLGRIAQEQRRFGEAEGYYKQALEIFVAFDDQQKASIVLSSFSRLWKMTSSDTTVLAAAAALQKGFNEVRELFEKKPE